VGNLDICWDVERLVDEVGKVAILDLHRYAWVGNKLDEVEVSNGVKN